MDAIDRTRNARWLDGIRTAVRDAALVTLVSGVAAVAINGLWHPEGIPLVAKRAYEILVPCPEPSGEVSRLDAGDPRLDQRETFLIDARALEEHTAWRLRDSVRVTYDYLEPTPKSVIRQLARRIAASRAQRVAVYGDGDEPDTGEQLAREIASHGIKHVFHVAGGAPALKKRVAGGQAR